MTQLDLLDERRHVKVYDGESIPDKELIEKILWRAWKVTPSKNNFMPYHVNVLGPERARAGYVALITSAFVSIIILVINEIVPILSLIALLAIYFGFTATKTLYKYYNDRLLQPANWGTIIMHSVTGILFCIGIWNG